MYSIGNNQFTPGPLAYTTHPYLEHSAIFPHESSCNVGCFKAVHLWKSPHDSSRELKQGYILLSS